MAVSNESLEQSSSNNSFHLPTVNYFHIKYKKIPMDGCKPLTLVLSDGQIENILINKTQNKYKF